MQRTQHPADPEFPYSLEVNDHHTTTDRGSDEFPRLGWACLWRHKPDQPVYDANPYPVEYIQEQSVPREDYVEDTSLFSCPHVRSIEVGSSMEGWVEGPSVAWDFIETVRDEYYEAGVTAEELPVRVVTTRHVDTYSDSPFDEMCEVYFRDRAGEVEFVMWNSNELFYPDGAVNSRLLQSIFTAIGQAYEEPAAFIEKWASHRVQVSDIEEL